MKKILLLGLIGLGGCAQLEAVETNLASPTTTQAANNVGQFVKAFACGLSAAAAAAQGVEGSAVTGSSIVDARGQRITQIVYASSSAACSLLGGVVTAKAAVSVPVTAVVQ